MHENLELPRWFRDLDLLGKEGEVEVVNVCDGSQSDELLEGYDWIFNRT